MPMQIYVADGAVGSPVYERCSLAPDLPVGVMLERPQLHAVVSVAQDLDRARVSVRFDVPDGSTLVLRENTIRIDSRDGTPPRLAAFANVNPAAPARSPETSAIQKLVLPADAPLVGGRLRLGNASSDKHYWIVAPVDGRLESDVWVTLPKFTIDDTPSRFPEIHFRKQFTIGQALSNC
ncbi:MAG: hypothetical protein ABI364_04860 [Caldimonas sp.]